MTAPERAADEIVDIAHENYGFAMGAVKPGEGTVTHRECLREAIRAVAPLIRAEGYKQGVEDAKGVAVNMILFCPNCGLQHLDRASDDQTPGWANPPHKSHLCHACAHIWRPADIATNGVMQIETAGKADTAHQQSVTTAPSPTNPTLPKDMRHETL